MSALYVLLVILALSYYLFKQLGRGLPPGPSPLPLIGNAHQFFLGTLKGKSNVDMMREWKANYGNVYTIWLGPMPVVLVCDYQTIVDSFVKNGDAHTGRPWTFSMGKLREGTMGFVFGEGPEWQEQRRFSLRTFRNFGFGKNIMQQRILEEAERRFEALDKLISLQKDRKLEINPSGFIDLLIGSIVNKLLAGYRYDESNVEEFKTLKHNIDIAFDKWTAMDFVMYNDYTLKMPFIKQRWEILAQPIGDVRNLMKKQIKERQQSIALGQHVLDPQNEGDDYIDAYLIEMDKRKKNGQDMGFFNLATLTTNLMDLWMAGIETTTGTFLWEFIYLLNYPEVQEKARREVLAVTGGNRNVEMTDKPDMPYMCAVVTETLRCGNILNFNLLRKTTTDTVVGDYLIPKGTVISHQQSVVMTDERSFREAQQFNPDRYFDNKNAEKLVITFGLGKRSCLGESLARAELFLITANFLQRYKISVPPGSKPPSMQQLSLDSMSRRVVPFTMMVEHVT